MSSYNFQKQFAPAIEDGSKRCTIRARRKNGYLPVVGEHIKLYTSQRTKQCRLLREVTVTAVTPIVVDEDSIVLDGHLQSPIKAVLLAQKDGFKSWSDYIAFFKKRRGLPFNGYLIEWKS